MHANPLNLQQRELVRVSFAKIEAIQEQAAALFYQRLFELDPTLEPLFPADLTDQGRKLMRAISLLVSSLDDLPAVRPVLESLGQRHVDYGVEDEHYELVGQALLWALAEGLGDSFNESTEAAWAALYRFVSGVMRSAVEKTVPRWSALARSA